METTDGTRPSLRNEGLSSLPLENNKRIRDMDIAIIPVLITSILTPIVTIFGFMLRRAFMKLEQTMTEDEVRLLVTDRLGPLQVNQRNIEHEINRIERKLDRILDLLVDERRNKQ